MGAVHVRVGHDDDLVVAQLREVEVVAADAGAEGGDERADLLGGEHLVEAGALHVEDLAAQGQHRLEGAVAALLGGAAGRVTLDQEQLGLGWVALLAVGELAGQGGDVERALAAGQVAGAAGGLARGGGLHHLADHRLGLVGVFLEPVGQCLAHQALHHRANLGGNQLVLGLRGEFRVRHLHREHAGEALAAVLAGGVHLLLLGDAGAVGIADHLPRQGGGEAGEVGAAVTLRDVVREAQHILVVAIVPRKRGLYRDVVALGTDHDGLGDERRLRAVEILHERLDAALVVQLLALRLGAARVGEHDQHARVQEGKLSQPVLQGRVVELNPGEGLGARQEGHLGAAAVLRGVAHHLQRRLGVAVAEAHEVFLAVPPDGQVEPGGERVHHRDAHAVQAAGDLVGILVELTARVQLGHDDLGRRDALFRVQVGGDAAAVVGHGHRAVGIEGDGDLVGPAGQRLVDGVVHHLVDHVVEARAVVGVADIHARTLAHRVQALQHLNGLGAVVVGGFSGHGFGHGDLDLGSRIGFQRVANLAQTRGYLVATLTAAPARTTPQARLRARMARREAIKRRARSARCT